MPEEQRVRVVTIARNGTRRSAVEFQEITTDAYGVAEVIFNNPSTP